ncbi:hypothetical protein, partial [Mycobacterium sp. GA-2829]|uniref:hypothetical protein n=1 Tax=Mycobacterium sp. GA-2829 TaxID=1772283 RepID=UPI001E43945C
MTAYPVAAVGDDDIGEREEDVEGDERRDPRIGRYPQLTVARLSAQCRNNEHVGISQPHVVGKPTAAQPEPNRGEVPGVVSAVCGGQAALVAGGAGPPGSPAL